MTQEETAKAGDQLRILIGALGGYLSGKGYIDESVFSALVGLLVVVVPMAWAWYNQILVSRKLVSAVNAGVAANQAGAVTEPIRPQDAQQIIKEFTPIIEKVIK